jgi:DNA-binding beta-propeller fold protein YncE
MMNNFRKFFKTYIFILTIVACFYALNIFASQFPDVLRLQPIPSDVHPSTPGNINKSEANSANNSLLLQQMNQYEFNESQLDPVTSYIDTTDHLLFITDTADNRVLVFDLTSDNALVDYVPDYVLGQPDFISSDPGTTQSTLNGPSGIAYDPENSLLFVADTNNNRIMVFDVSSIINGENAVNVLGQPDFTSSDPGTTQSTLNSPYSLDYDPVQNILFVTDVNNNRVVTFNIASINNGEKAVNVLGQPDFTSSGPGTTQSKFNSPSGLAYDPENKELFVADTNNKRIMVFGDVSSISNGEDAVNIFSWDKISGMSPSIAARMQSEPENNANSSGNKAPSTGQILFWLIVFFIIAILITVLIFYMVTKKKNIQRIS